MIRRKRSIFFSSPWHLSDIEMVADLTGQHERSDFVRNVHILNCPRPPQRANDRGLQPCRRPDMLVRSPDLEDRIPHTTQLEIFTLPIEAARREAREVIDQFPQSGLIPIIENWRQRPDGQIEFAIRHLPTGD
jgi:hypothetical protein